MGRNGATAQRIMPSESAGDKVLVLAEGNITLVVENDVGPVGRKRAVSFWPALAVGATLVALTSTVVTAYTALNQSGGSEKLNQRLHDLETRLADVVESATVRTDGRMEVMMLQMDDLGGKVDLLPTQIDDASRHVRAAMVDSFTTVKDALNLLPGAGAAVRPVLVVRRRKAMTSRW